MDRELWDLFGNDDEVIVAAATVYLNVGAAVLDCMWRDYAEWVKIRVNVDDWKRLGDPTFKTHFRMSRTLFDDLVTVVANHLYRQNRLQRIRTDLHLIMMMALWILMNMDTFKNAALHFNTSPGVVLYHYLYVIEALRELVPVYIQWPSPEERRRIKQTLYERTGYIGAVGLMDGMHSFVTSPLEEAQAYVNRHHTHSILTQAVVDDNMVVRDLYVSEAGSLHDSRVFRRSPLGSNLLENPALLEPDEHILADGAYILTDKVIVPYDNNGALNEAQLHHNKLLSACRSLVERAFCFVKMRFPRLKYFRSLRVTYAVDHIVACFVLHNFITLSGEELPRFEPPPPQGACGPAGGAQVEDEERGWGNFPEVNVEPDHPLLFEARLRGDEKRERIAARLFQQRAAGHN